MVSVVTFLLACEQVLPARREPARRLRSYYYRCPPGGIALQSPCSFWTAPYNGVPGSENCFADCFVSSSHGRTSYEKEIVGLGDTKVLCYVVHSKTRKRVMKCRVCKNRKWIVVFTVYMNICDDYHRQVTWLMFSLLWPVWTVFIEYHS